MINGQSLLNFAQGDPEKLKMFPLFQKTVFLQKFYYFLQNIKIDGIFTLIEVKTEDTFERTP